MECRRSDEATTGFGVVSKGLLRVENAWTTLEPRPDSACLDSAWPSFVSSNLRSHLLQRGCFYVGVATSRRDWWESKGKTRWWIAGRVAMPPIPRWMSFLTSEGKREWKRASMPISLLVCFLFLDFFVYTSRAWFPWRMYPLPILIFLYLRWLSRWQKSSCDRETRTSSS